MPDSCVRMMSACDQDDQFTYPEDCQDVPSDECGDCCNEKKFSEPLQDGEACGCRNTVSDSKVCASAKDFQACETCCFDGPYVGASMGEDSVCACEAVRGPVEII